MAVMSSAPTGRASVALGNALSRVDGVVKVTGQADYTAEHDPPGTAHAVLITSQIPSGRIRNIDTSFAEIMPGVIGIVSQANAMALKPCPPIPEGSVIETFLPFQDDLIRYAGQPVAAIIAETQEEASEAARYVYVDYAVRLAVADIDDPNIKPPELSPAGSSRGDAIKAFAASPVRIEQTYTTPREYNAPIEMHATLAVWGKDGTLTVWEPSQWVEGARRALSHWFSLSFGKVRVISPFVGGGFGAKVALHAHAAVAAMAAKQTGRPVKLSLTRAQNFTGHGGRPATKQTVSLGADRDGRLRAIMHSNVNETSIDDVYVESGADVARLTYASPAFSASGGTAAANIITPGWMRAPGEAVGAFALECAIDELACQLKIDPIELRLRNWAEQDPSTGKPWSTRKLREAYDVGARAFGWAHRSPEPRSMRKGRELTGWGMAGGTSRNRRARSGSHPHQRRGFDRGCHRRRRYRYRHIHHSGADGL